MEFTDESPVTGELRYVVLRAAGSEGPLGAVTPQPIAATSFTDTGLQNDTDYRYAVRAVRMDPRAIVTGPPSPTVAVTPLETARPAPPSNLVVIPSAGALRLAWSPSPAANIASYAVYRAAGAEGFVRIGTTTAGNTTFIDRDVRPGIAYRYAVSAFDNARQPNESVRSNEATATLP
jgi:fibronectin type 3 domain-containing protein